MDKPKKFLSMPALHQLSTEAKPLLDMSRRHKVGVKGILDRPSLNCHPGDKRIGEKSLQEHYKALPYAAAPK